MEGNKTFGDWSVDIHISPDQEKRIASAKKKETTPLSVDKDAVTAIFPGSGKQPYNTTLDRCTCVDFVRRKLPCKHIYRLAMECGLIEDSFEHGFNKNLSMSLDRIVATIEGYSDYTQMRIGRILAPFINPNDPAESISVHCDEEDAELLSCPLFDFVPFSLENTLNRLRMKDIQEILRNCNVECPKVRSKTALITFCLDCTLNWDDLLPKYYTLTLKQEFKRKARQTRAYLRRKYEWDEYFNANEELVKYPAGSKAQDVIVYFDKTGRHISGDPNLYFFPDDEVTRLLTLYGHNRCENGFTPKEEHYTKESEE